MEAPDGYWAYKMADLVGFAVASIVFAALVSVVCFVLAIYQHAQEVKLYKAALDESEE